MKKLKNYEKLLLPLRNGAKNKRNVFSKNESELWRVPPKTEFRGKSVL